MIEKNRGIAQGAGKRKEKKETLIIKWVIKRTIDGAGRLGP